MNIKINHIILITAGLFLLSIFAVSCSNTQKKSLELTEDNRLIDSLIIVKRINDETILLSFDSDAVTAINTQNGIVIIDAGISTGLTSKYRKIIENEFHNASFK